MLSCHQVILGTSQWPTATCWISKAVFWCSFILYSGICGTASLKKTKYCNYPVTFWKSMATFTVLRTFSQVKSNFSTTLLGNKAMKRRSRFICTAPCSFKWVLPCLRTLDQHWTKLTLQCSILAQTLVLRLPRDKSYVNKWKSKTCWK